MGRAPRTKETLPDFLKWRQVTRHPLVFRGLTGSQRTPGFGASHSSFFFSLFSFPSNFLSPHQIVWFNKSSEVSSLATCHPLIGYLGFPLSSYPYLWIFTLSSCHTCPHGSHLDPCLTCSSFDTWLHMSHPTCAKCQLITLGALKNVKF